MIAHPFLSQITQNNGLYRPFRVFRNVGATAVGATVRSGQSAAIVDVLNVGFVYTITSIRIKTITPATLATTITIKNGTTTIFTKNILLANIPGVGIMLDVLLNTAMPADITLPATLTCSASNGVFDIIIDGLEN